MGGIFVVSASPDVLQACQGDGGCRRKNEQGQRQDRLKNAIEHLGIKSESVRLRRGLNELFHLAKDTLDEKERKN